jgi:hypothetical protein
MSLKDGDGGMPGRKGEIANGESPPVRYKKPYQPPAFRCERVFETMALACGKISPTQTHCNFNRKSS